LVNKQNSDQANQRVLHVVNGEFYAGAERVQDLLALNLPDYGYDVEFICLKRGIFAGQRAALKSPVTLLEMNGKFDLTAALSLRQLIHSGKYSVVHAHTPRSLMVAALATRLLKLPPLVYHVHGPTLADTEHKLRNIINASVEHLSAKCVDIALPVSDHARDYARSIGIPDRKLQLVPNGVPASGHRYQSEPDTFVVGSVALFRPRKGLETLIDAFSELVQQTSQPCRLRLIGGFETDDYRDKIANQAEMLGISKRIDWIGHTTDVYQEMQHLSAFVLPSLYGEGMPMVILEAMANSIPVVATRAGGIGEMIDHNHTGLLCEPGDSKAMGSLLAQLANDPQLRTLLSKSGKEKHFNAYSAEVMARRTAAVYDRLLATG